MNDSTITPWDAGAAGWIDWIGGNNPVCEGGFVYVRQRNGTTLKALARRLDWRHAGTDSDIVAYKITQSAMKRSHDTFATDPVRYSLTERNPHVLFRMLDDRATPPNRATDGSAGWDLYAVDDHQPMQPGEWRLIGTGVAVALPEGWCGQIWPRSGWALSAGYDTLAGLIDNDYRNELKVLTINHGHEELRIRKGYRVGQLVVVPCLTTSYIVDELPEPTAPHDGWGSSGK